MENPSTALNQPRYYAVNDRPVKLIPTPEGGTDALTLDMRTGVFGPDRGAFERISDHGRDVELLDESMFMMRVAEIRKEIAAKRERQPIRWELTGDGEFPYFADLDGCRHTIRVNDFPAEPLYTLLAADQPIADLDDWPSAWTK